VPTAFVTYLTVLLPTTAPTHPSLFFSLYKILSLLLQFGLSHVVLVSIKTFSQLVAGDLLLWVLWILQHFSVIWFCGCCCCCCCCGGGFAAFLLICFSCAFFLVWFFHPYLFFSYLQGRGMAALSMSSSSSSRRLGAGLVMVMVVLVLALVQLHSVAAAEAAAVPGKTYTVAWNYPFQQNFYTHWNQGTYVVGDRLSKSVVLLPSSSSSSSSLLVIPPAEFTMQAARAFFSHLHLHSGKKAALQQPFCGGKSCSIKVSVDADHLLQWVFFVFVSILGFCAGFLYNNEFHNVVRVNEEEFLACKASAVPHADGDTVFHLNHPGRQFYICTHVGHCAAGMKLEVTVSKA
jgi:hypothetical protein